jgi:hypothetical protein
VSVVIPAYNRAKLVARAVASARDQRPRPPAEVIVVDDASVDGTGDRAAAMGARVVRHAHNRGEADARNTGMQVAGQAWVALLDSDDEWLPHHLDTLWALRGEHVVVADSMLVCGPDPELDRFNGPVADRPVLLGSPKDLVFPQNFINPSATMFRRDAGLAVGGYVPGYGTDLHFLLRLLERGTGLATPVVGGLYHVHQGQMTQDIHAFEHGLLDMLSGFAGRPWWSPQLIEKLEVVHRWDELRRSVRAGGYARALAGIGWIACRPARVRALIRMLRWRLGRRRRSALVGRDGRSTVAVLPGWLDPERKGAFAAASSFGAVVDLTAESGPVRLARRLGRRPTAMGLARTRAQRRLLRLLGIQLVEHRGTSGRN